MIIKKFQAKTEEEAVAAAKKELGDNIVIMNVRQLKRKGLLAFLKPQLTEVTVALEEESETFAQKKKQQPVEKIKEEQAKANTDALEEKLDSLQSLLVQQMSRKELPEEEKNL